MRNTFGKLCVIVATLLLLFSVAFWSISLVLQNNDYIEEAFQKQNVSELMGMSTPDLAAATDTLLSYMRGERENIRFSARVNGVVLDNIFYHEKEVVHMAEVQTLWLGLTAFSRLAPLVGTVLLLFGVLLTQRGARRLTLGSGVVWGAGIFGGVLLFFGAWAIMNFQSFWTVFHFIIFPGSLFQYLAAGATPDALNNLNWVLSNDSIMVNMLMPIFPPLVLRCAIIVIIEIAAVLAVGLLLRLVGTKRMPAATADIVTVERDVNEPVAIDGPDLVLSHQLRNAPVSKREELKQRAKYGTALSDTPNDVQEPEITLRDDTPEAEPEPEEATTPEPEEATEPEITLRDDAPTSAEEQKEEPTE